MDLEARLTSIEARLAKLEGGAATQPLAKVFFPCPEAFDVLCRTLLLELTPDTENYGEALRTLPDGYQKYSSLTGKQWNFFKVIFKKIRGKEAPEPKDFMSPNDFASPETEIPF